MRIALLLFADFPHGEASARRIHMIGKGLAERGHDVHVIVPQRFQPGPFYQEMDGLHVHWGTLVTPETWSGIGARLAARKAAINIINDLASGHRGLDWILLSNPSLDGLLFLTAARVKGAFVAAMYDDARIAKKSPTTKDRLRYYWIKSGDIFIPRLTQLNIAISTYLEQELRGIAGNTPTVILPPLVDVNLFKNATESATMFRSKWELNNTTVISYLGTYWNVDGVASLLKAVALLSTMGDDFKLMISGMGISALDCDDVPALISRLDLQQIVIETGWLTLGDVIGAMSAADILVIPKLSHIANRAGVPTKLAEYLAIGRPVVVSEIGDIPLYLRHGHDAFLCAPGDVEALAEALHLLIHNRELRIVLSENARVAAIKNFDYRSVTGVLESAMLRGLEARHS